MNLTEGHLNTNHSSFSFAVQSPWIFEDTFRNNILVNCGFESIGDFIMIGENEIILSSGQKARVSFACALYGNVAIYLLDDPLSVVDHRVAQQIYERCIGPCGLLKNKTRLLTTHQAQFLSESNQIIFLSHGYIDKQSCLNENNIRENYANNHEKSKLATLFDDDDKSMNDNQSIIVDEKLLNDDTRGQGLNDAVNYWLSICLKQYGVDQPISTKSVYIYFGLLTALVIADLVRTNYYFPVVLNGSSKLHNKMLKGLLYTSIQFFESNPTGKILNRASKDQYVIDKLLPITLLEGFEGFLLVAGSLFMISFINPYVFLVLILLTPVVWLTITFFLRCSRRFKRLESITRSPVYALFSSSLNGLPTIRSLQVFINVRDHTKSPAAALSLTYTLYIALLFNWAVRQLSEVNIMMISGERIDEYSHLPCEENEGGHKARVQTSPKWPTHGKIEFRNYSLRHRLNLPYAIRNINLDIESGQKIGIIGRTDFGTLRYNLDPLNNYSDEECWIALEDVQRKPYVSNHALGLLMPIGESGKTLSTGPCQFLLNIVFC
ncbi:unnamed protein product [Rotaria sp. Silwood1]|nr:unnamed protein product [Rotaria sp. Silwood1]CAF0945967.1 unnamed protein product [Rotaria sp. Silwood1]